MPRRVKKKKKKIQFFFFFFFFFFGLRNTQSKKKTTSMQCHCSPPAGTPCTVSISPAVLSQLFHLIR